MTDSNYHKYLAASDEDKSWGLHLLDCGSIFIPSGVSDHHTDHPKKYKFTWEKGRILDEYQLIYVVHGSGHFQSSNCQPLTVKAGDIFLLFPGIWHRYRPDLQQDWKTYWIGFEGSIARAIIDKIDLSEPDPIKTIGHHDIILNIFNEILDNSQHEFPGYQQVLAGNIMTLIGWIHAIGKKSEFKEADIDTLIKSAKTMLVRPKDYTDVVAIADTLNIGYSKFRKLFKEYTGMSPGQYRMQHQIRKAIDMLLDERNSIKDICAELGFESTQYFSRIFKQKTGRTPGSYR